MGIFKRSNLAELIFGQFRVTNRTNAKPIRMRVCMVKL